MDIEIGFTIILSIISLHILLLNGFYFDDFYLQFMS